MVAVAFAKVKTRPKKGRAGGLEQRKAGSGEDGRHAATNVGKRWRERENSRNTVLHGAAERRRLGEMSEKEICERTSECGSKSHSGREKDIVRCCKKWITMFPSTGRERE